MPPSTFPNSDLSIRPNHQMTNNYHNNYNSMISCCYLNTRSLVNKLSIFQSYIYSSDFDVICLTETWLSESIFDQEILPINYNIYRKDRHSGGGGVLIAIKDTFPVSVFSLNLPNNAPEAIVVPLQTYYPRAVFTFHLV